MTDIRARIVTGASISSQYAAGNASPEMAPTSIREYVSPRSKVMDISVLSRQVYGYLIISNTADNRHSVASKAIFEAYLRDIRAGMRYCIRPQRTDSQS